jgi:hypothetical protein
VETALEHGHAAANVLATLDAADSTYSIEGVVRRLDLSAVGIDSTRRSSINARFTAEGRGFD